MSDILCICWTDVTTFYKIHGTYIKSGVKACVQYGGGKILLSSLGVVLSICIFVNCSCLVCIVVILCVFVVLCVRCSFTLNAGLLARSQYPEGPATGHLDTGFSWFLCVYKRMLKWFPSFQVAIACFSCSPPDLNFLVAYFIFV
jgi:hypothetical protein